MNLLLLGVVYPVSWVSIFEVKEWEKRETNSGKQQNSLTKKRNSKRDKRNSTTRKPF
jgi:hypothetical protein